MNPDPAHFAQRTIGKNRGVFDWDVALIIEPIRDPAAQRFGRKPAFVHRDMKRMFVVISALADRAQLREKGFAIQKSGGHNDNFQSIAPDLDSGLLDLRSFPEPGMRIGFVLLMWV